MDIRVGDTLKLKKTHPCGGDEWLVLRCGMDFRLRCLKCGREWLTPRVKLEKSVRELHRPPDPPEAD